MRRNTELQHILLYGRPQTFQIALIHEDTGHDPSSPPYNDEFWFQGPQLLIQFIYQQYALYPFLNIFVPLEGTSFLLTTRPLNLLSWYLSCVSPYTESMSSSLMFLKL